MDNTDKIWILMGRSLSGEISTSEQEELSLILFQDPNLNQQFAMLKRLWDKDSPSLDLLAEEVKEKALFNSILTKADTKRKAGLQDTPQSIIKWLFSKKLIYAYAASLALIIFYTVISGQPQNKEILEQQISAQNGSKTKLLLPDGTTVWLNGGSKLYYDFDFAGDKREVRLEGEAFFDVVKEVTRPFIVHAGKIDIKVHGTAFNVKYYQGDKNIETTLLHGKIEVSDMTDKKKPSVFLVPNQKLIVPATEPLEKIKVRQNKVYELVNLDKDLDEKERIETAWIYNRMEFRGEKFDDLAKKFERWYNVSIEFKDEDIKKLTFNGSFERETVDQAIAALQKVGNFNYKIQGREISIQSPAQTASGLN